MLLREEAVTFTGNEPGREQRVAQCYWIAVGYLAAKTGKPSDVDQEEPYISGLVNIHDHKGAITCTWTKQPPVIYQKAISMAWALLDFCPIIDHVVAD